LTVTGALLLWAILKTAAIYRGADLRGEIGWDASLYAFIGSHFVATGQAYFPIQAAPYVAEGVVNIYPPTALYLFVPASFLPSILWWIVPLAIVGWSLLRLRPAWWAWPFIALGCALPIGAPAVPVGLVYGNTLMWTMALLFAAGAFRVGIAWGTVLKPTDFLLGMPLALRSWRGLLVTIGLSALVFPLWFDWFEAMRNLGGASPLFRAAAWPALAIPLLAYVSRTRTRGQRNAAARRTSVKRTESDGSAIEQGSRRTRLSRVFRPRQGGEATGF
jgi:hypothetical protein